MNFRLPISLKDNFDQICQVKNISMSTQLNLFIREFVDNEIDILPTKEEKKSIWFKDRFIDPEKTTKGTTTNNPFKKTQLIPDSWRDLL